MTLRVGAIEPVTEAMGPGRRLCIWVKGCSLDCPGCTTPEFIPTEGGMHIEVDQLHRDIRYARAQYNIEGVSFSGGEPFEQAVALAELARLVRADGLSVLSWSGYAIGRLKGQRAPSGSVDLLAQLDALIDGPFVRRRVAQALPLRGSDNQRIHLLTSRYAADDFAKAGFEGRIEADGSLVMSGVADAQAMRYALKLLGMDEG